MSRKFARLSDEDGEYKVDHFDPLAKPFYNQGDVERVLVALGGTVKYTAADVQFLKLCQIIGWKD